MAVTNEYVLPKGRVWFSRFKEGTRIPEGFREIGNAPEFNITIESETLDHFSSQSGVQEKDASITLRTNRSGTLTTDNVNNDNLALFFLGTKSTVTVMGETVANEALDGVILGMTYQIGRTSANPTGARNITDDATFEVVDAATGAVTYVKDTDYTLNAELGLLTILEGGSITEGEDLELNYVTTDYTYTQAVSGSDAVEGSIKFIADNATGANRDVELPYVKISPNGDFSLVAEEWMQIPFSIEVLKPTDSEAFIVNGRPAATPE